MGYGVSDVGQRRRKTQLAAKKNKRRSSVAAWEGDDGTGHIGNRQTRFMLERMKKDLEKLEAPREDLPEAKFTALQDAPKIRRRQSLAMWQADPEVAAAQAELEKLQEAARARERGEQEKASAAAKASFRERRQTASTSTLLAQEAGSPARKVAGRELRESLAALVAEEEAKEQARKPKPRQRRKAKRVVMTPAEAKAAQEARIKAQEAETAAKIKAAAESGAAFFAFDHKPKEAAVPEEEAAPKEELGYGAAGDVAAAPRSVHARSLEHGSTSSSQTTLTAPSVGSHKSSMQKSGATERSPLVARARQRALQGAASGQMAVAAVGAVAVGERAKDERQERKHPARDDSVFTCAGHRRECFSCACSNDGRLLASGSEDGTARVWDATTGALVRVLEGHGKRTGFQQRGGFGALVSAVAFSPDGASLATGCRDNLVRVFDLGTGKIQLQLKGHGAYVSSVEFNVDGGRLVSGSYDETAVVWNAVTGKKRMALLDRKSGHRKTNDIVHYVHHASYDRRGDRVVCASRDGLARIWDGHWDGGGGSTGRLLLTLKGHEAAVLCAKFFVDGRRVVTASQDKSARTWDAKTGDQLAVLLGHTHHITAVACLADGRLVTGAKDYTIRVWEDKWKVHNYDHRVLEGHADRVMAVALAQNDGLLVSASFDRTLKCWDPDPADELFVDRRYAAASAAEAEGLLSAQGSVSLAVSQQGSALEAVAEDGEESWLD